MGIQPLDHPPGPLSPGVGKPFQVRPQALVKRIEAVAQQMDLLAAHGHAQFDAGDELDRSARGRRARRVPSREGVVVRDGKDAEPARGGLFEQRGRGELAVRVRRVGVQVRVAGRHGMGPDG